MFKIRVIWIDPESVSFALSRSWHFVDPESRWVQAVSFWMFKIRVIWIDPESVSFALSRSWHFIDPESRWVQAGSFWMFKCYDQDSWSKCFDPESGSFALTRNPVICIDPESGSFELTRNPGHLNWPGIRVIWIDPESGVAISTFRCVQFSEWPNTVALRHAMPAHSKRK